jgi:hypothetical protein
LPHYTRFVCLDGNATFSIYLVEKRSTEEGVSIYFESEDLDDKVTCLIENGIQFYEKLNDKDWLWREARLKDLDANLLILFYGGENRINLPWKIKS